MEKRITITEKELNEKRDVTYIWKSFDGPGICKKCGKEDEYRFCGLIKVKCRCSQNKQ